MSDSVRIRVRPATPADVRFVFDLSNDPTVRANSTRTGKIEWEGHVTWFSRAIDSPDVRFYIVETLSGEPVGQCRLAKGRYGWECSGSLLPAWRGKGLSARFLRTALRASGLQEVVGFSKTTNRVAIRPLVANGYEYQRNETIDGVEYEFWKWTDRVYTIAEMSANHRGDLERAKDIVRAAAAAGADAIKLQTYTADTMTLDCRQPPFVISGGTLWDGMTLHELYSRAATPWAWTEELMSLAASLGIDLFSTPFDRSSVDFLDGLGVSRYKIASFEAVDLPLIRHAASKGKPMFISTGICSPEEMQAAVDACAEVGNGDVTLLKCTSAYPAAPETMHVSTLSDMRRRFAPQGIRLGLSDHSLSVVPDVAAVALGARVIEKHLTIDRPDGDAEASFSLLPDEFAGLVKAARDTLACLGEPSYEVSPVARAGRRSLFVAEDVRRGEAFTERNLRSVRPGDGCAPDCLDHLIGRCAACDLRKGTPMREEYAE